MKEGTKKRREGRGREGGREGGKEERDVRECMSNVLSNTQ